MSNGVGFLLRPWNLPSVQLEVYEALAHLVGTYPEGFMLRMSSILGRPHMRCQDSIARCWAGYESYRTSASICDATAIWLWKCLRKSQPRFIIELGTGFSTLVMASYARYRYESDGEQVKILSIEHDEKWYESQRAVLSKLDLLNRVHLVHSPLGTQTYSAQQVVCYSTIGTAPNQLDLESKADFVFVDGPVGLQHGGAGRGGSILQSIALARKVPLSSCMTRFVPMNSAGSASFITHVLSILSVVELYLYGMGLPFARRNAQNLIRFIKARLPKPLKERIKHLAARRRLSFGGFHRLTPISRVFGYDRGPQSVARYYIDQFLSAHAEDVHGHVLEIGDNTYTLRLGEDG